MNQAPRDRLSLDMPTIRIIGALAAAFIVAACVPRPARARAAAAPAAAPAGPAAVRAAAAVHPQAGKTRRSARATGAIATMPAASSASYAPARSGSHAMARGGSSSVSRPRAVVPPRSIVVRTTYGERRLPAGPDHEHVRSALAADDPLLDQIAFSRGRFLLQAEGGAGADRAVLA